MLPKVGRVLDAAPHQSFRVETVVADEGYELRIRVLLDTRQPTIDVIESGRVPQDLVEEVIGVIRPHCRGRKPISGGPGWPRRAWGWFRAKVWPQTLAQVLGGTVVLALSVVAAVAGLTDLI
ncbi:hypothetical protein [Nonomuraea rubra]|uniref:hypothetical protein n=1 Tax=Nonomuraea rubra TaxID=46180 RepID=UPI003404F94D